MAHAAIITNGSVTPDPNTTNDTTPLYVADGADGDMTINGGSAVTSADGYVGFDNGSTGSATVDGDGSTWNANGNLYLGVFASGQLTVANNAAVSVAGQLSVGSDDFASGGTGTLNIQSGGAVHADSAKVGNWTGNGTATVTGPGSTLQTTNTLWVGHDGAGQLTIDDGGLVSSQDAKVGVDGDGTVNLNHPDAQWQVAATLELHDNGTVNLNAGLVSAGGIGFYGLTFGGAFHLAGGTLQLNGGSLGDAFGNLDLNFDFSAGRLENAGSIDLAETFTQSAGTLAPGGSTGDTAIEHGYTITDNATLEIELADIDDFDTVTVHGDAALGGTLSVAMLDGYAPDFGDSFAILSADNVNGTFASLDIPHPGNDTYLDVSYQPDAVLLTAKLLGDMNGDGIVDGLDLQPFVFALLHGDWRPAADCTGNHAIDVLDIKPFTLLLKPHDGITTPEPGAATLLLLLAALRLTRR